jgi:sugar diacid utilization regulator
MSTEIDPMEARLLPSEDPQPAEHSPRPAEPELVERMRVVHLEMVDAVLSGDGLGRVAELAAQATGGAVAIVIPRRASAVVAPGTKESAAQLQQVKRYASARLIGRPTRVPDCVVSEVPVTSGDDALGAVALLTGPRPPAAEAPQFLHLAAVASLTEVAVEEAREEVEQNLRGSLLEDLRSRSEIEPDELARRAGRLGCDLSAGAVVLCAELTTSRPRHVVATIREDYPGALAQHMDGRVYALLPASPERSPASTQQEARKLAERVGRHGTVGLSSFYAQPADLRRGIQEAELVVEVMRDSEGPIAEDIGQGTYRLLFRVLASHPDEVRAFYEDTVSSIVSYDEQYRSDLVGTLQAYLDHNCNMNATAAAIYAHRHTVAYRLERVRELTGLDPMLSEDRERLGLGLKAYRIIAPRLPR